MGVALKDPSNLDSAIENAISKVISEYKAKLISAGEMIVNFAKTSGNYEDDTGDLRNSIGFLLLEDSKIIHSDFTETAAGNQARNKAVRKGEATFGLFLIVIAGMDYAYYVETKGFDVLTSAAQIAQNMLPKLLKE